MSQGTAESLSKQSRVRVMERCTETALMSKRSQGVNVCTADGGLSKMLALFGAHFYTT